MNFILTDKRVIASSLKVGDYVLLFEDKFNPCIAKVIETKEQIDREYYDGDIAVEVQINYNYDYKYDFTVGGVTYLWDQSKVYLATLVE